MQNMAFEGENRASTRSLSQLCTLVYNSEMNQASNKYEKEWLDFLAKGSLPKELHQPVASALATNSVTVQMVLEAFRLKKFTRRSENNFLTSVLDQVKLGDGSSLNRVQRMVVITCIINRCIAKRESCYFNLIKCLFLFYSLKRMCS